ncbi:MAG: AraC family transcriptional regulator [Candidatus Binataceae bacterium]
MSRPLLESSPLPRPRATVAAGFVSGMLAGAPGHEALLGEFGISRDTLRDPYARVSLTQYAALYNRLVATLDDEAFGLFSTPLRCGVFEFLCRSLIGARDLEEALRRAAGYLRTVLPDLALRVERNGAWSTLEITETRRIGTSAADPRRVFAYEWLLRLIHGLACWLVGRSLPLETVQFPYPRPAHADDYAAIYTEHPRFGGDHLIARFHAELLRLPIHRDQEAVAHFLEGAPGKIAVLYRRDHDMAHQIRDVLATSILESPSLEDIARHLHLSLRTVQRRLKQEGSSFRAVKESLRRKMAITLVENSAQPIAQIARSLGYAESSAFFRAFVDWTGEAPTRYRKRHREMAS